MEHSSKEPCHWLNVRRPFLLGSRDLCVGISQKCWLRTGDLIAPGDNYAEIRPAEVGLTFSV